MSEGETPVVTVGERYVLVEEIDTDDDRQVWLGHDDLASRSVVVKLYDGPNADDAQWRERFRHSAARLATLRDPGIASVLEYDADDAPVWLVQAAVPGRRLDELAADDALPADQALRAIGQLGLALTTAHDAGVVHGRLNSRHVMVRDDGSVTLIGFELPATHQPDDDLAALRELAGELLPDPPPDSEAARFLTWLATNPTDAGDLGRTALALAVAAGGGPAAGPASVVPRPVEADAEAKAEASHEPDSGPAERRPWYDEAEKRRVRNGLVAFATIVVVAGAALLWLLDRNTGPNQTNVPDVVGLTLTQAQTQLTGALLVVHENITDPQGLVAAESPTAGTEVKVGTTVTLIVRPAASG